VVVIFANVAGRPDLIGADSRGRDVEVFLAK